MSLIDDSDLGTFLGNSTLAGTQQAILAAALASGVVQDVLGSDSLDGSHTVTDVLDGPPSPSNVLLLTRGFPVTAVSAVSLWNANSQAWQDLTVGVDAPGISVGTQITWNSSGLLSINGSSDPNYGEGFFPSGIGVVQVTYTYGSDIVPAGVQAIALSLAARIYSNPTGLVSESVGSISYSYGKNATVLSLDPQELLTLGRYTDRVIG